MSSAAHQDDARLVSDGVGVTPIGFIAFLVLMGWTLVVSVLAFRRGMATTAAPQAT